MKSWRRFQTRIGDSRELSLSFVEYQKRSRLSFSGFEGADELSINAIPQTLVICVVAYFQAGDWIDSLVS
ncbi:MAG: hypothetical protein DME53_07090 [Verrucomicrobia bacterium]|jgi:hypothetical protein|nr:MAG: hypothetical protein DME53_07090 [Verrucomicrobiota bacterium]